MFLGAMVPRRHRVSLLCDASTLPGAMARPSFPAARSHRASQAPAGGARACAAANGHSVERGASFKADGRFFRPTSCVVRDLGVLAASVLSKSLLLRRLHVLDVCSGTGVRALRYLGEAPTEYVWANDAQSQDSAVLIDNLAQHVNAGKARVTTTTLEDVFDMIRNTAGPDGGGVRPKQHSSSDTPSLGPVDGRFDLVDMDMFGAGGFPEVDKALDVVNLSGGLLYLSSTDSVSAAGRNPEVALRAWHADAKPHPSVNEQFLRLVIGACAQAAAAKNLEIKPVFSYFHPISSTARVMIRVKSSKLPDMTQKKRSAGAAELTGLGFVTHCTTCGQNGAFSMCDAAEAAKAVCPACSATQDAENSFVVSGPLWVGRLHNADFCREMRAIAHARQSSTEDWRPAYKVLSAMIDEAALPPLFYTLGDVARRIKTSTPPRQRIADELARQGFVSSPAHCRSKCIKTNAPYEIVLAAARTAAEDVEAMVAAAKQA
jgi:tRNA (guanine26-N2/guanine27-N2)-dimethyltransferase